jgi:hypothetical protein
MEGLSCKIRSVDQASADINALGCVTLCLILTHMHACKSTYSTYVMNKFLFWFTCSVPGIGVDVNGPYIFEGSLHA